MYWNGDLSQWDFKGQPLNRHHHGRPWQHANQHLRKGSDEFTAVSKLCVQKSPAGWQCASREMKCCRITQGLAHHAQQWHCPRDFSERLWGGAAGVTHVLNHSILCLLDHLLELSKTCQFKKSSKGQIFVNWEEGRERRKKRRKNSQPPNNSMGE